MTYPILGEFDLGQMHHSNTTCSIMPARHTNI